MSKNIVLLCSHRKDGKSKQLKEGLSNCDYNVEVELFSDVNFMPCVQCAKCKDGYCTKYLDDGFNVLMDKIKLSNALIIVSPLYSPIPSKLAAFLERLTSISYFAQTLHCEEIPLKMKKCSVIGYDSKGINNELELLIKSIIKPSIIGYLEKDEVVEYKFVELSDPEESNSNNVSEYFCKILNKINLERRV